MEHEAEAESSRSSLEVVSCLRLVKVRQIYSKSFLGGKHFSRNLRPLDADGNEVSEKDPNASTSEEEEDSGEESSSEEEESSKPALSREERRAAAKAKKEAAIARKKNTVAQPGDLPYEL